MLRYFALLTAILSIVILAVSTVLAVLDGAQIADLADMPFIAATAAVGGFISFLRPRNTVGWLLLVCAAAFSLMHLAGEYALFGLVTHPGSLPGARLGVWLDAWLAFPGILSLGIFLPQYFPDGHVVSPRWHVVVRGFVILGCILVSLAAFRPQRINEINHGPALANPLGIPILRGIMDPALHASTALLAFGLLLGVLSLALRFRRASIQQQLQIKWLAYAVALIPLAWLIGDRFDPSGSIASLALVAIPAAVTVAVFHYHLYDIDVIINRTLVYGSLTLILGGSYILAVIGLDALFHVTTGQNSDLAIALSTLFIAVLFQPLRGRVQQAIDLRFYRRRYDAVRALAALGATLRDDIDLDGLARDILHVVEDTVQPAHAVVWFADVTSHPPSAARPNPLE